MRRGRNIGFYTRPSLYLFRSNAGESQGFSRAPSATIFVSPTFTNCYPLSFSSVCSKFSVSYDRKRVRWLVLGIGVETRGWHPCIPWPHIFSCTPFPLVSSAFIFMHLELLQRRAQLNADHEFCIRKYPVEVYIEKQIGNCLYCCSLLHATSYLNLLVFC